MGEPKRTETRGRRCRASFSTSFSLNVPTTATGTIGTLCSFASSAGRAVNSPTPPSTREGAEKTTMLRPFRRARLTLRLVVRSREGRTAFRTCQSRGPCSFTAKTTGPSSPGSESSPATWYSSRQVSGFSRLGVSLRSERARRLRRRPTGSGASAGRRCLSPKPMRANPSMSENQVITAAPQRSAQAHADRCSPPALRPPRGPVPGHRPRWWLPAARGHGRSAGRLRPR